MTEGLMDRLMRLQELDRKRDRLQKKLDEVPVRLKAHSDAVAAAEAALEEHKKALQAARAETERIQLDIAGKEAARDKVKTQMNAPKLTGREYSVLQEQLAGILADIGSLTDRALAGMERVAEAEKVEGELRARLEEERTKRDEARDRLEASLGGVRSELEERDREREAIAAAVPMEAREAYERVRRKHRDAMSVVEGTIDRAAGRIGNDLHCSACYMTITPNDAVKVLAGQIVVQCKSCVRILYVP